MVRDELAKNIFEIAHLKGEFKLRSGATSNKYFDKYRFEARPELLKPITEHLAELIPKDTEVLAGLEMGGIPIATSLSLHTGLPVVFVRKEAKEYGTCQFAEGYPIEGKKVCVVEDVVTSGGQLITSTKDLRGIDAQISDAICVILRKDEAIEKLASNKITLHALYKMEELTRFG